MGIIDNGLNTGAGNIEVPSLLTKDEQEVINHLACAWNAYIKIGKLHPNDTDDFAKAIHDAQKVIMWRPMLREYGWEAGGYHRRSK